MVLLATPSLALANAGTPLMWFGFLHLAVGNALIGLAEGLVFARMLKLPRLRCILTLVAANYASALAGDSLIATLRKAAAAVIGDSSIEAVGTRLAVMAVATFFLTLVVEAPFAWWAARRNPPTTPRLAQTFVTVNVLSYAVLLLLYYGVSGTSLLTSVDRDQSLSWVTRDEYVLVYYIDEATDKLASVHVDGSGRSLIDAALPAVAVTESRRGWLNPDWLFAINEGERTFTLQSTSKERSYDGEAEFVTVLGPLRGSLPVDPDPLPQQRIERRTNAFGPALTFRSGQATREVWAGLWPIEGLMVTGEGTSPLRISWETPFESWAARSATELESGQIIYQLGRDQIVILDPATRKFGLLARGRCPVVVRLGTR